MTKQFYIYYFIALFAAISCSKEPLPTPMTNVDMVTFNPLDTTSLSGSDNPSTRTVVNEFKVGDNISVLGYFLDDGQWNSVGTGAAEDEVPNFMYDQEVTMSALDTWNYTPAKFWSNDSDDRYRFFAYYPYANTNVNLQTNSDDAGYPSIYFTSDYTAALADQVDFMVSSTDVLAKPADGRVNLDFTHALSKIRVLAKTIGSQEVVVGGEVRTKWLRVEEIAIRGANTEGELNFDFIGPTWSDLTDIHDYNYLTKEGTNNYVQLSNDADKMLLGSTDGSNALFIIPQSLDEKISLRLKYTYFNGVDNIEYDQIIPLEGSWEMNTTYNYQLIFDLDNLPQHIEVRALITDWSNTFDIQSEVQYTYINVEKPEYTIKYTTDNQEVKLNVNFTTNAEELVVEYLSVNGGSVTLDADNKILNCTFYPNEGYTSDFFTIKAGIVSTDIKIIFVKQLDIDYTSVANVNDLLGVSSTSLISSNCYILNPSSTTINKYYIPITKQVGTYYPQVLADDSWKVMLYAYDNAAPVTQINIVKEADRNGADCFSVTLPNDYTSNDGNILVAVTDASDNILWTWHLWLTDYNPYALVKGTPSEVGDIKKYSDTNGTVYRHKLLDHSYVLDRNIGAWEASYAGQGGLGGRGWLSYQYGRLAPIMGHTAHFGDGSMYLRDKINVSATGKVSQLHSIQNPNQVYYGQDDTSWCSDGTSIAKIWNDPSLTIYLLKNEYAKSIFDPSPLGYMVPPIAEYDAVDRYWVRGTNGFEYTMSSGNKFYSTVNIESATGNTSLAILSSYSMWSNTNTGGTTTGIYASSLKFYAYYNNPETTGKEQTTGNVMLDGEVGHTFGAPVRPIFQFEITD